MKHSLEDEIQQQKARGVLLILTGPTGAGKDSVMAGLAQKYPQMARVITTTTRAKRPNESEGNPYQFITRDEFEQRRSNNLFFEWVEFRGELYGTEKKSLTDFLDMGNDAVWKIEMNGIKNVKEKIKEDHPRSVFIFLTGPDVKTLEQRVLKDPGGKHKRWDESLVIEEMDQYDACDYLVVNEEDKIDESVNKISSIIEAKRLEII